ncbi:helix-turn-helix domain-containing protein [Qipengyuania sp. DGS5-3]|uniref:helix-turn-helix domain-containing protein n=1 Tax=Qipengyuania sp. DGS5-3 TaxID=3349632 RepID=UPI0036D3580A
MSSPYYLRYYDPPEHLQRYILVLFHFYSTKKDVSDRNPGAHPQLILCPQGTGGMRFPDGRYDRLGRVNLAGGMSTAIPFDVNGPWHTIGATLSPLGWAALTGVPLRDHMDRFFDPEELLGPEITSFADDVNERYLSGELSGEATGYALCDWIAERLKPIKPEHEALIEQTLDWLGKSLNPPLAGLYERMSYSRRQTERLVERYFGSPPAALARKYRAIRAAALLAQPKLSDRTQAIIAAAFHDRPHMVHEISRYCAHTPTRLGGDEDPILVTLLQMKNFQRLQLFNNIK